MKFLITLAVAVLLFACRSKSPSFDTITTKLFFHVEINNSYDKLVATFKNRFALREIDAEGWTIYPPLSALGQSSHDEAVRQFEFHNYPNLPTLKNGVLKVKKIGHEEHSPAFLQLFFWFDKKSDAENAYKSLQAEFSGFPVSKAGTDAVDITSKPGTGSPIKISIMADESTGLHVVEMSTIGHVD